MNTNVSSVSSVSSVAGILQILVFSYFCWDFAIAKTFWGQYVNSGGFFRELSKLATTTFDAGKLKPKYLFKKLFIV